MIDAVVTAEHVGSYKPALGHFRRFEESFAPEPGRWVHVAQGYHHDMEPAHRLGLPSVWINRLGEDRDESICGAVQPDLDDLLAAVERVRAVASLTVGATDARARATRIRQPGSRHIGQIAGPPGAENSPVATKPTRSYSARDRGLVASRYAGAVASSAAASVWASSALAEPAALPQR